MIVDKAKVEDIEQLSVLFNEYRIFYQYEAELENTRTFLLERIQKSDSEIFVARDTQGLLMGFIQLYPLFSSTRMKKLWLLNDLYVHPKFRGLKVSVALIDRAKQLAKETGSAGLLLETAKSNTIGNNLYRKTDFVLDIDHNYYSWS
jgi:ribosomal protein S18 acetylase RimI-like enzyme